MNMNPRARPRKTKSCTEMVGVFTLITSSAQGQRDVGGLGPRRGGRRVTWRCRSKRLVNTCVLGQWTQGTQRGLLTHRLCLLPPVSTPGLAWLPAVTAPSWNGSPIYIDRQLEKGQTFFLSLLDLEHDQPKLILMPKRHMWGSKFFSPKNSST